MVRALLLLIFFAAGSTVFGQGAHYTYPFAVECPDEVVVAGGSAVVAAKFENGYTGERYAPTYSWSVSQGTILSGQGTPTVTVEIGRDDSGTLVVSLDRVFKEAHFPGVQQSANCSIAIAPILQPKMFDEFPTAGKNCEEGFARLDAFLTEIDNNPNDAALIVFYGEAGEPGAARRRATQLRNHFRFRKFDRTKVRMIFGPARQGGTTQFWLIPPGTEAPNIAGAPTVPEIERPTKTMLYASEYMDGVPGCDGNIYDLVSYSEVLKTDAANVARIVIGESSQARYRQKASKIRRELRNYGVPSNKIVTVYKFVRPNRLLAFTELWIVPPRRRPSRGARLS
ncbi:MAG TPA: hypothetical protein VMZ26_01655 [Pyrinomonadaceae bacterium]|nr:hypothetical protein [Pyrinomonadaceae bacterium]